MHLFAECNRTRRALVVQAAQANDELTFVSRLPAYGQAATELMDEEELQNYMRKWAKVDFTLPTDDAKDFD